MNKREQLYSLVVREEGSSDDGYVEKSVSVLDLKEDREMMNGRHSEYREHWIFP